ncbi:hypothetical protein [Streptomyces sp. NBRC 110035]|uniref:hypothetical protein n=1 Tax=Streptomyces sp. NBRC 110035 TaxID=1547867 RepID=UPI0005AA6655|nr:hypothetical protein [Streptomyces sp. NBRC 110035]
MTKRIRRLLVGLSIAAAVTGTALTIQTSTPPDTTWGSPTTTGDTTWGTTPADNDDENAADDGDGETAPVAPNDTTWG